MLFPGRPILGIGHGVLDWMGQIGARAASPLTLLGEHLDALTALLDGQRVSTEGRYVRLRDVALDWPPDARPPVFAGAEGPKTLALVGAKADGVIIPEGKDPDTLRRAIEQAREGRVAAGRDDPLRVVLFLRAAFGPGAAERLAENGRRRALDADGGHGVAGTPAEVADRIRPWIDAGADSVILQPMDDEPDPEEYVRIVAEEVRPLVP